MKNKNACILAGLFLAIIIATAAVNYIYVQSTADQIEYDIASLSDDLSIASSEIPKIRSFWEERRSFLSLTLSKPDLDNISSLFEELSIAAKENNDDAYKTVMARLKRAIAEIKDLERISIENIF